MIDEAARRQGGKAAGNTSRSVWRSVLGAFLLFPLTSHVSRLTAVAQAPTSLTLYNDGRALVRRTLPLDLPKGDSEQRLSLGPLDPSTVFPMEDGVNLVNTGYDAAVDEQSVLRRSIGKLIKFRYGSFKDTISAELVGVDPERYRMPDGTISFSRPGMPLWPAELVALEPTIRATVNSNQARKGLKLGYFTQGGGWSANYEVILGAKSDPARIMGRAVIHGGNLSIKDAELQLLAGEVSVAASADEYRPRAEAMMLARKSAAAAPAPAEQKVGEFHLYTLPGRTTLQPGLISTVGLFEPTTAKTTKSFQVTGQIPYWGGLPQYGDEEEVPVTVTYTVLRPRKTDLGDRPLPGGVARLYEADSTGRLQLIGESGMDHSPAGEDLRLNAGNAFDLTAKRIQTNYATRRDSTGGTWRTIATADYKVTLNNAADLAATVEVVENRGGEWAIVSSSIRGEKLSSTRTVFRVPVPAKGKATLTYRVRVIW